MAEKRWRSEGVSSTFLEALLATSGGDASELDTFISKMESALIWCIEGSTMNGGKVRYSFPTEVMEMVVNYRRNNGGVLQSRLWTTLHRNIRDALDINTVANNKVSCHTATQSHTRRHCSASPPIPNTVVFHPRF